MIDKICVENFSGDIMTLKENKSKFIIKNANNLVKILVDGCAIKDGIRCDYLVKVQDKLEIFIELKGQDIEHAINQIERSIQILSSDRNNFPKQSYVVCTRSPMQSPEIQLIQKRFKKKYNSAFFIKSIQHEITV